MGNADTAAPPSDQHASSGDGDSSAGEQQRPAESDAGIASTRPASADRPARRVEFAPGVVVLPEEHAVELESLVCLDAGYLEQVACSPHTREHESLVVIRAQPSQIHAAMLLAGFEPGKPGYWTYENEVLDFHPPQGAELEVDARFVDAEGKPVTEPIRQWIIADDGQTPLPSEPWIFGGSAFESNPESMGPGEHYVADMTGSIIGLVTFGDEVIGFSKVMADKQDVQPLQWVINVDRIPPIGTPVTVIIRRWDERP
jgi:hypothetical protein